MRHRSVSSSPVKDAKGNILGAVSVVRDITESKRAEKALQTSQERLAAIIDSAMDAIITIGSDGDILVFNDAAERVFGCPATDAIGHSLQRFLPVSVWEEHSRLIQDFGRDDTSKHSMDSPRILTGKRANGEEFPFEATISQVDVNEEKLYTIILRDITERREAQNRLLRSESQLRALTTRLETAAERERLQIARELHDQLGPVLTGMKFDLDWIIRKRMARKNDWLPIVQDAMNSIDSTIALVRRFATELRPEMLDSIGLEAAIQWHAEKFQRRTGISCVVEIPEIHLCLSSDHNIAVFRIFQEAMTNIARHSQAKKVRILLKLEGAYANLMIEDDGIGFLLESIEHSHSLGILGMTERAMLVGAQFSIQSAPGQGTTIALRIPLTENDSTKHEGHEDIYR